MPEIEPVVPAQPDATPEVLTVAEQAVVSEDVSAYRSARQAERSGKPLASAPEKEPADDVDAEEPAAAAVPAPQPERQLSKRQQQINDYERTIAEQKAEIARLKTAPAATPAPRREPAAAVPAPKPETITYPAELASYDAFAVAHPEESYEDYISARTLHLVAEQGKQASARVQQSQVQSERSGRLSKYAERLAAIKTADPTFDPATLRPEVGSLRPLDVLEADEVPTALNVVAQEIMISEHPDRLLKHFHDHPEELTRLSTASPREVFRTLGALERQLEPAATREPAPSPQITKTPTPPTTLGSRPADTTDPIDAAVASGDVAAYRAAKLRERASLHR